MTLKRLCSVQTSRLEACAPSQPSLCGGPTGRGPGSVRKGCVCSCRCEIVSPGTGRCREREGLGGGVWQEQECCKACQSQSRWRRFHSVIQNKDDVRDQADALSKWLMTGTVGGFDCCLLRSRRKDKRVGGSDSEQAKPPSPGDERSSQPKAAARHGLALPRFQTWYHFGESRASKARLSPHLRSFLNTRDPSSVACLAFHRTQQSVDI